MALTEPGIVQNNSNTVYSFLYGYVSEEPCLNSSDCTEQVSFGGVVINVCVIFVSQYGKHKYKILFAGCWWNWQCEHSQAPKSSA